MRVPFLDLTAQLAAARTDIERALLDVVASGRYIGGPVLDSFELAMAEQVGVDCAIGVSSGSDALLVSLMALDVGPGDLVFTTPYTFFATAGAIARLGAVPVFVDIDPRTFNIDPAGLAAWFERMPELAPRVRAIVPVHLFGRCADMAPILELAAGRGIPVVEDAAQALGATADTGDPGDPGGRRPAGSMGKLGCFSFYPTKSLGAFGDAGLVVTSDVRLAERVRRLRNHGGHTAYRHPEVGGNFRLDTLQAAVLGAKLPYLDGWLARRRALAARYHQGLAAIPGLEPPADAAGGARHAWHQYVIRTPGRRDALRAHLAAQGVDTMIYYPLPLHRQPCFRHLGLEAGAFPHAEHAAATSLALPIYPEMTPVMQDHVIEQIAVFFR